MNMTVAPVMMTMMNPNNYLARKDDRKRSSRPSPKKKRDATFDIQSALYEPTDPETALREFYAVYGR